MANWTLASLVRGIRTTRWPSRADIPPGAIPLRLDGMAEDDRRDNPPRDVATSLVNTAWTFRTPRSQGPLPMRFRHSVHVRFVDAGANGACISEVRLIDAPPYNLHRFGIFITASPRDADVLMVAGSVTEAMREPLRKAWEAMATPRRVVAIGDEAIDGGIFGKSFASAGGVHEVIPVDFIVPGCPPPPLAIIQGLLAAAGKIAVPQTEMRI